MTDVKHIIPSDGSKVTRGRSQITNNGTIATGLTVVSGMLAKCESADTVAAVTSITNQTATVSLKAAGGDATGSHYVNWEAWTIKKV